jgi:hypothetical protein
MLAGGSPPSLCLWLLAAKSFPLRLCRSCVWSCACIAGAKSAQLELGTLPWATLPGSYSCAAVPAGSGPQGTAPPSSQSEGSSQSSGRRSNPESRSGISPGADGLPSGGPSSKPQHPGSQAPSAAELGDRGEARQGPVLPGGSPGPMEEDGPAGDSAAAAHAGPAEGGAAAERREQGPPAGPEAMQLEEAGLGAAAAPAAVCAEGRPAGGASAAPTPPLSVAGGGEEDEEEESSDEEGQEGSEGRGEEGQAQSPSKRGERATG